MKEVYTILYGSRCYGTATPNADIDIRGILLPTLEESLSMTELKDIRYEKENKKGILEEVVMYPIQKFFRLAVKSNPSVFEWMFVGDKCIRIMEPAGKMIRDNRLMFLSKEIYPRFKGFAYHEFSSLTKLTGKTGEKRRKKILKYGYDPKSASNCIRLLQQGIELLETSNLLMPRPNCKELLEIKMGKWTYKQIANTFDNLLKDLDKALKKSKLPDGDFAFSLRNKKYDFYAVYPIRTMMEKNLKMFFFLSKTTSEQDNMSNKESLLFAKRIYDFHVSHQFDPTEIIGLYRILNNQNNYPDITLVNDKDLKAFPPCEQLCSKKEYHYYRWLSGVPHGQLGHTMSMETIGNTEHRRLLMKGNLFCYNFLKLIDNYLGNPMITEIENAFKEVKELFKGSL